MGWWISGRSPESPFSGPFFCLLFPLTGKGRALVHIRLCTIEQSSRDCAPIVPIRPLSFRNPPWHGSCPLAHTPSFRTLPDKPECAFLSALPPSTGSASPYQSSSFPQEEYPCSSSQPVRRIAATPPFWR